MSQNILDFLGNVIGTIELGEGTPQSNYDAALALYSQSSVPRPVSGTRLKTYLLTATGTTTTSSAQASTVGSMTVTPEPGIYQALFTGNIYTEGASAAGEFGLYVDGVLSAETRRDIKCNLSLIGGLITISLNTISVGASTSTQLTLNGNQIVDVRFKSNNGGTIGFSERTLQLTKVQS